ncbi:MAG: DUF4874 domain-containing protein [Candidatus Hodarchaeota archaeon]
MNVIVTWYFLSNQYNPVKRSSFEYEIDNSIPLLTHGDNTSILLENPDRGFRMESYMTLGTNISYPSKIITGADEQTVPTLDGANASLQVQLQRYAMDSPRIIQQYIYLTLYTNQSVIPQKAFDQLTAYFEYVRSLNIKILLRFAYINERNLVDPTDVVLFAHIAQLKDWFEDNEQLVADTVYCLQLGFIGWWGEGHSNIFEYDVPDVITAVCEMVPSWMYVNCRTLWYHDQTPEQYKSRMGIHDDFMVGYYDGGNTVMPDIKLDQLIYRDLFQETINDGELPWGSDGRYIDGMGVTRYAYDYSLSTLSIVHNYIESGLGNPYNMYRWKSEYLDENDFKSNGWNYNPRLLDENGEISIFEYLKYHLGYQLVLSNLETDNDTLGFMISNYGFAAPFNMDTLSLQIGRINGSTEYRNLTYTPHDLYTFHQLVYSVSLDLDTVENASVKLLNSRNNDYVRFGNNIVSSNGYYQLI